MMREDYKYMNKKNTPLGKMDKFGLLWVNIFINLYLTIHSRVCLFFLFLCLDIGKLYIPSLTMISMKCGFNASGGTLVEVLSGM